MPQIDRMKEFLTIVQTGSIAAAARALKVPRATVSRHLSGLEQDLGVRLLHRRTTGLTLTEAGQELHRRAVRIVADAEAAWASVRRLDDVPRGLLRVSVTGAHFANLFSDLLNDFPEVQLEVLATTRHVDLIAEGVDVAMRVGVIRDQDLIVRQIREDRLVAVASPVYVAAQGTPQRLEDIEQHTCLLSFAGDWSPSRYWPLLDGGQIAAHGRFSANDVGLIMQMALNGQGIALLPSALIRTQLAQQSLVPILPHLIGSPIPVSLVYADRQFIDPKVRLFVDRAIGAMERDMPLPYRFG